MQRSRTWHRLYVPGGEGILGERIITYYEQRSKNRRRCYRSGCRLCGLSSYTRYGKNELQIIMDTMGADCLPGTAIVLSLSKTQHYYRNFSKFIIASTFLEISCDIYINIERIEWPKCSGKGEKLAIFS